MYLLGSRVLDTRHYFGRFGFLRNEGRALFGTDLPPGMRSDSFVFAVYKGWDVEKLKTEEPFSHVAYVIHRYLYM